ncbi:MAG: UDP-glucose 4-epimerase GalE [Patescibacteria group bacterium]
MNILVTGGAGYIGSFMVKRLIDDGHTVIVADSLERGQEKDIHKKAIVKVGDLADKTYRDSLFKETAIEAIIHFAGYISVGESMESPYKYFHNNVAATLDLIEDAHRAGVNKIIFSSSAAVYGNPTQIPIPEDHQKQPTSVYGESKLMVEDMLRWYGVTKGLNSVSLRYFNACGAALDGSMGEAHEPETHIIPRAIQSLLEGKPFTIFGEDYKTPDGTCVRDYIHVLDLVEAHVVALKKLESTEGALAYNVGTGKGYSNKEIVAMIEQVSGQKVSVTFGSRRAGDPDELVADVSKIKNELGFEAKHSDLKTIIESAYTWHKNQAEYVS